MQPKVNKLPMVFGVLNLKVNGIGNELAVLVNKILNGGLL